MGAQPRLQRRAQLPPPLQAEPATVTLFAQGRRLLCLGLPYGAHPSGLVALKKDNHNQDQQYQTVIPRTLQHEQNQNTRSS